MRRNKVLNTLAAASMAAMMAVTAVPATTVLAAPAEETALADSGYKAVLNTDGTVTVFYADGTEVPAEDVKTTGFGSTYKTGDKVTGTITVGTQSFEVELTAAQIPEISVDQIFAGQGLSENEGRITSTEYNSGAFTVTNATYAPKFTVKGGTVTSTKLTFNGQEVATPQYAGTYQLEVNVTGADGYNDYTKTYTFSTFGNNDAKSPVRYSTADDVWGQKIVLSNDDASGEKRTPVEGQTVTVTGTTLKGDKVTTTATINQKKNSKGEAVDGKYELTGTESLKPGSYSVDVTFPANEAYGQNESTKTFKFNVTKRNLTVAATNNEVPYKAAAYYPLREATYTLTDATDKKTVVDYKSATVTGEGVKKDANDNYYVVDSGSYTVNFTLADSAADLYNAPSTAVFTVVGNREQTVTLTVADKTYDGDPAEVKAVGQSTGAVTYTYKDADGNTLDAAPVDAGTYTVTATVAGDKNYKSASATKKYEIAQVELDVEYLKDDLTFASLTYDGKKQIPDTTLAPNKSINGSYKKSTHRYNKLTSDKDFSLELVKDDDGTYAGDHSLTFKLLNKNYKLVDSHLNDGHGEATEVESAIVTYSISQYNIRDSKNGTRVTVEDAEVGETPVVHVYAEDGNEIPTDDYSVTVTNNTKVGTGTVAVSGIKNEKAGVKNVTGTKTVEFNVVAQATVEKQDLYRLYNPNTGEHFFTTSEAEKNNLVENKWTFEGVAMKVVKDGGTPVYRLYNKNNGGEHVYTTSKGEANSLVRAGWAYEGVAFNAAKKGDKDAVKIYRVYNPNKVANNHHYTQSWGEKTVLVSKGWRDEGVAFYAYKAL